MRLLNLRRRRRLVFGGGGGGMALVQTTTGTSDTNGMVHTFLNNITIGSGTDRVAVVAIFFDAAANLDDPSPSVTLGGVSMTQEVTASNTSRRNGSAIYTLINPSAGAKTIVVTEGTATLNTCHVVAQEWTGANQTNAVAVTPDTVIQNGVTTATLNQTPTNNDSALICACCTRQSSSAITTSGDITEDAEVSSESITSALGSGVIDPAAASSGTFTWTGNAVARSCAIVLEPA